MFLTQLNNTKQPGFYIHQMHLQKGSPWEEEYKSYVT
jgi:hypothetical protein